MTTYDWIVIGAGITGAALAYELARQGFAVLLLERHAHPLGATRFSYGGVAYWSGTTDLTRQLCAEGIALHRSLPQELDGDTEFRELNLLLTIAPDADPQATAAFYTQFAIPPQLLTVADACALEPLLNPAAIAAALTVRHGHIDSQAMTAAYIEAFQRLGGTVQIGNVTRLLRWSGDRVTGVVCEQEEFSANGVAVCAGGLSRALLAAEGIPVRLYFTHAEVLEIPPVDLHLHTLVMPAETKRFQLEATATTAALAPLWEQPGQEPAPPILDAGAIQFLDGSLRIGQISRTLTDPHATVDPGESEQAIRTEVGAVLPALQHLPATWHSCLIAFSGDRLPLVGAIPGVEGVYLFSGFSNPLALVPPLARRFAAHATGQPDDLLAQLSPGRFVA
jgi:glycine/D-amino acid oxidase-like deaminating enzyme